jgi:hypothetical protein
MDGELRSIGLKGYFGFLQVDNASYRQFYRLLYLNRLYLSLLR